MKLVLASGSQNRQQGLTLAQIPFKAIPADIDEAAIQDIDIKVRVIKVAKAKVEAVAKHHQGIILGADGVNLVNGKVFEKPKDKKDALRMIEAQSGIKSSFLTGFYIFNTHTGDTYQGTSETNYTFRVLTEQEIENYINTENVYNWAAAFSPLNSSAITFLESCNGSPSNFAYSIPFEKIIPILKKEKLI